MSVLKLLSSNGFISFNKTIARRCGVNEAIVLGELCSIFDFFNYKEFYINQERISNDTSLSVKQIRTAINNLGKLGLITITKKGQPCKNWYTVKEEEVIKLLSSTESSSEKTDNVSSGEDITQFDQTEELDVTKLPNKKCENVTSSCDKTEPLLSKNTDIRIHNKNTNNKLTGKIKSNNKRVSKTETYELELESLPLEVQNDSKRITELFVDSFKILKPNFHITHGGFLNWQLEFANFMLENKEITSSEIIEIISWAMQNNFWSPKIHNAKYLTLKYDAINIAKSKEDIGEYNKSSILQISNNHNKEYRRFDGSKVQSFFEDEEAVNG